MIKKIIDMMDRITNNLKPHEYKKIDDIRVELLVNPKKATIFDRAWQELAASGRVNLCGNSIRLNQ